MRDLLRFILRHHFIILFIILESFSFYFLVNFNEFQRSKIYAVVNSVSGNFHRSLNTAKRYFALRDINRELIKENARLRNLSKENFVKINVDSSEIIVDSTLERKFRFIPSKVINNTVNRQYNYLTLDRGERNGIKTESAVVSEEGIVGIVNNVSSKYSTVISILNKELKVSAKIKSNNYYGVLEWDGLDYRYVYLHDIPHHVRLITGDTIVTSGLTAIFPEGIPIGTIVDYKVKGGNFYTIKVALTTNFKTLNNVYIVDHLMREEINEIESLNYND